MIAAADAARLEAVIRREGRSLLQYLSEAFPWSKSADDTTADQIRVFAAEEREALAALTKFLARRRHTVPYLGAFPMAFTTMNFVAMDYVLPRLAEAGRRALDALQKDRSALSDADAQAELDRFIELKRRHVKALETLATAPAMAAH